MASSGTIVAGAVVVIALGAGFSMAMNQLEARQRLEARVRVLTGGNPDDGRLAIASRPCGSCHQIPGVTGAQGKVGPSLQRFAGRIYIGGRKANTPDNLIAWIKDPHSIDPQNVMPPMGIPDREARNIAAYLYTLR